jgi:hypothetical protein
LAWRIQLCALVTGFALLAGAGDESRKEAPPCNHKSRQHSVSLSLCVQGKGQPKRIRNAPSKAEGEKSDYEKPRNILRPLVVGQQVLISRLLASIRNLLQSS